MSALDQLLVLLLEGKGRVADLPAVRASGTLPSENAHGRSTITISGTDDLALAALSRTLASLGRSDFKLRDVLQSVVEEAAQLCQADAANIAVRDGAIYRMRITRQGKLILNK